MERIDTVMVRLSQSLELADTGFRLRYFAVEHLRQGWTLPWILAVFECTTRLRTLGASGFVSIAPLMCVISEER
jgi:hypothetical protein